MIAPEMRFRKGDLELRAVEGEDGETVEKIAGYGAVFGRSSVNLAPPDAGFTITETVAHGAFDKSVREGDVDAYWNHNGDWPLGNTRDGTLLLSIDDRGVQYLIEPGDDTHYRNVVEWVRRRLARGSSFGFRKLKDEWREDPDGNFHRTLLEIALFDMGPVVRPAYPDTDSSLRSLAAAIGVPDLAEVRHAVETRSLGQYLTPPEQRDEQRQEPSTDPDPEPDAPAEVGRPRLLSLYA